MTKTKIDRRDFLKVLGLGSAGAVVAGCDMPSYVTLEEGEETVVSYLAPEEYVIPGIGVWYASTCLQCSAGCGIQGRVREGRVLKLEGNPASPVSKGKMCQMGHAGLQAHFNPDRISEPMIRRDGKLSPATWDEALKLINAKASGASWLTGTVSGHQRALIDQHLAATGGEHYVAETVNTRDWEDASAQMLGDAQPRLRMERAKAVLSLGADLLGTFGSPVANMSAYGEFRGAQRGVLIQAEPAMSLTGANADHWLGIRPGSEADLGLMIAQTLYAEHEMGKNLPRSVLVNMSKASAKATGLTSGRIKTIANILATRQPSVVVAGGSADASAAKAAHLLNIILGNVGRTISAGTPFPHAGLAAKTGSSTDFARFATDATAGKINAVFVNGSNPLFTAPGGLRISDAFRAIGFKVALTDCMDETAAACDVVLPMQSALEDWGTHVPAGAGVLAVQQPLMEPVFPGARGLGDVLLDLARGAGVQGLGDFDDYYGYLRTAVSAMIGSDAEADWNNVLQTGQVEVAGTRGKFQIKHSDIPVVGDSASDGMSLVVSARQGLLDGRHANSTWLQEAPDQISKVVWDSWAELHPATAASLGVADGDYVKIATASGDITTRVFTYKGVHPDVVCVPMGRGHTDYGRYATGIGVNPLSILDDTSMIAGATVTATGENRPHARLMDVDSQYGRKLVGTISAAQHRRTEGGA